MSNELPYNSAAWSTWERHGPPVPRYPIPLDPQPYIYEQEFRGKLSTYVPIPLDTAHPTLAGTYLADVSEPRPIGGGIGKVVYRYAAIPDPRDEINASYQYTFPGGSGTWGGEVVITTEAGVVITRSTLPPLGSSRSINVPARVRFDYWLPGQTAGIVTSRDIPIVPAFQVINADSELTTILADTTSPTLEDYEGFINAGFEIVAGRSTLAPWFGNIIERQTIYVRAT